MASLHSPRLAAIHAGGFPLQLLYELAAGTQDGAPATALRLCADDLESAFGRADVQVAAVGGPDLRYLYVNAAYRQIRPEVPMIGRTYRETFPEAARDGAEAHLLRVIAESRSWHVEDYPTWLPGRPHPAWWQGECVPLDLQGGGRPDAVLILIWEVTSRHLPGLGPPARTPDRLRIEAARMKLLARMESDGLTRETGWRVAEEVEELPEATLWRLRPMHLRHRSPTTLLEVVEFPRKVPA